MKIQDQVITIEQAKRLKELGVTADTFMIWMQAEQLDGEGNHKDWVPALFVEIQSSGFDMTSVSELPEGCTNDDDECHDTRGNYAAYTVAELGMMMPTHEDGGGIHFTWKDAGDYKGTDIKGFSAWGRPKLSFNATDTPELVYPTEAQARGALLIHLLENNIITADQCNTALS